MKCNYCGEDMPYGGYGICTECLVISQDIDKIKKAIINWSKRGYGSIDSGIDYVISQLELLREETNKQED